MTEQVPDLLEEIRGRLDLVEANLPRRIEAGAVFRRTKLPFHTVQCREALAWRCAELAREAYDAIQRDRLATGILLTRAVIETVAAQWYLRDRLGKAVSSKKLDQIKTCVNRLLLGSRTSPDMPQAINVLDFVDAATKEVEGLRDQFDRLCEFAHPNWAGTSLLYSEPNLETRAVEFGRNVRGSDSARVAAVANLSVALLMFEVAYNGIADLIEPFIELCEGQLDEAV